MTLGFSTHIRNKPTRFVQKIWASLFKLDQEFYWGDSKEWGGCIDRNLVSGNTFIATPKIHTIREDSKDRWKAGRKIHFVVGNRTKSRFQFAPIVEVKSIQYIRVLWFDGEPTVYTSDDGIDGLMPFYIGDNKGEEWDYGLEQMKELAANDGFTSIEDFFKWFKEDFTGKIIHWTDYKYS